MSMTANSRAKTEPHRGADCVSCEACRSRLQKLDELELKQAELEMMLQIYQKKLDLSKRLLDEYHAKEKTFLDNIGKIFNGDQIVRILTGHCQKRRGGSSWDDGTLKKAAKLYFLCSPQGYQEILHLKMPLPSSHTLQNVIQKGRPQPLSPKTSVFDPFASTSDLSSSIALVRRGIVQQNRQKDSSPTNSNTSRSQQVNVAQPQGQQDLQYTGQQQQQQQPQMTSPLNNNPPTQLPLTGVTSPSLLSIPTVSAHSTPLGVTGSMGTTIPATVVYSTSAPISKVAPRSVYTPKISSLDMPDYIANLVADSGIQGDTCEASSSVGSNQLHENEMLQEVHITEPELMGPDNEIEMPPSEPQVTNAGPTKEVSVERAVGACVRALVDQVVRPPQVSTVKPRAPYVSILRNPNDPNAPTKYNLVVPRHLLRPGQRILLKTNSGGVKSSAPTVQIIEQTPGTRLTLPTTTGTPIVRQLAIANPSTLGGQVININQRSASSPVPAVILRPQLSGSSSQGHLSPTGQSQIIEIAGTTIGDLAATPFTAKRPRLSD